MEDTEIIKLFNLRSERAIEETGRKYGITCGKIAGAILKNHEDAEECVNTAYYKLWNTIPPTKPESLCCYLFKIVRNTAITAYNRLKRNTEGCPYEELNDLLSDSSTVEAAFDSKQLAEHINAYLSGVSRKSRELFTARYYFNLSMADIAKSFGMSESAVKTRLLRIRRDLRVYLEERGVTI